MVSFTEIIITAIIFTIAAFGILALVSLMRPTGVSSTRKLEAAYIGKQIVDRLRSQMDANTWHAMDGPLRVGQTFSEQIGDYTVKYELADVPNMEARELIMTITWPDDENKKNTP